MTFAQVMNLLFVPLWGLAPAGCTAVMMLNGRFSGYRTAAFFSAFMLWIALGFVPIFLYLSGGGLFDRSMGIILMPGFAVMGASTMLGVLIGGTVIMYEDARRMWHPEHDPRDREDIPTDASSKVINLPRAG